MLVPNWLAETIAWGLGGGIMLGALLLGRRLLRSERPLRALVVLPVALFGLIFAVSKWANGTRVLIVQSDRGRAVRQDLRLYGVKEYRFRNGSSGVLTMGPGRHVVVNDTVSQLTLTTVRYGYGPSSSVAIAPFSSHHSDGIITNFGPQDAPPSEIQSSEYGAQRYWLRW